MTTHNDTPTTAPTTWAVYATTCRTCGVAMRIVATVESVDAGTCETFQDGQPECQVCQGMRKVSPN